MTDQSYQFLQSELSQYSHIHEFYNDSFIKDQCQRGLNNYILRRLSNHDSRVSTAKHLPTLERRLTELAGINGYNKLGRPLRGASDWDEYQEVLAQIDITLWFKQKGLVIRDIEPSLPHRNGNGDILVSFSGHDIYCEAHSPQSIAKSAKLQEYNGIDEQEKGKRILRVLLKKTNHQLPPNHPGILAIDTTKSAIFQLDVRDLAKRLFPQRPQVALIALWSWEGDGEAASWDMKPSYFFTNGKSQFYALTQRLISHLNLVSQTV